MGNQCPCFSEHTGALTEAEERDAYEGKEPLLQETEDGSGYDLAAAVAPFKKVGLGTWLSKPGEVETAVKSAIEAGYRHIDCASNYLNEAEIGDAIKELIDNGTVAREELFITGKLNNPYHKKEHVRPHLEKTLKDLNLEYLDLWLMHWPVAFVYVPYDPDKRGFDEGYDPDGCSNVDLSATNGSKIDTTVSFQETWEAMEECVEVGLVHNIGVCNVNSLVIHDLLSYCKVKPAVVQNEMHPLCQQNAMVAYLKSQGIVPEAYSPLGAGTFRGDDEPSVLENEILKKIGERHGKSAAQVALRWNIQRGCVVIPKSVNPERIKQNIDIEDFELSDEEMQEIKKIDQNYHFLRPNEWYQIPHWTA